MLAYLALSLPASVYLPSGFALDSTLFLRGGAFFHYYPLYPNRSNYLTTQLQATPWWDDSALAESAASVVGNSILLPNGVGVSGPLFAAAAQTSALGVGGYVWESGTYLVEGANPSASYTYSVGSAAVPEPLTILGSITAAGFGVAFKRKKNSKKG